MSQPIMEAKLFQEENFLRGELYPPSDFLLVEWKLGVSVTTVSSDSLPNIKIMDPWISDCDENQEMSINIQGIEVEQ